VDLAGAKLLVTVLEESEAQRTQRLAQHSQEVAAAELSQELKKKKRKPKKRVVDESEYQDPALVGVKKSKPVAVAKEPKKSKKQEEVVASEAAELEDLDLEMGDEGDEGDDE